MAPKIEKVIEAEDIVLGEGPHWDAETQTLYFVDIGGQNIHKYVPATGKHAKASIGKHVSFIIPVKGKNDEFVISMGRELGLIKWDGESQVSTLKTICEVDENTANFFNDGKCDPTGRLWAGTIGRTDVDKEDFVDKKGNLFSFQNGTVTKRLPNTGLSNGLAFDANAKKFYYVDTVKGTLDQYDFDVTTGEISNEKPIFTLIKERGFFGKGLDGMTIDTDGNVWVAVFNDARIIKIDPRKPEVVAETIELPTKQVTSLNFGGPNLDELYVTTGRLANLSDTPFTEKDGATYKVTGLNAKGYPGVRVVL